MTRNDVDADLVVTELVVRFGGLVAVDGVSLRLRAGSAVGLVGPNGAGKTTIFNACSGILRPSSGRIELLGSDVTRKSPAERAQLGLGRTFQRMELFDRLSVADNVRLGREARFAGRRPLAQFLTTSGEHRQVAVAAERAMRICGIEHLATRKAGVLSTGERRLVELARAVAGEFRLLLLDEPSSGLDDRETSNFASVLRRVVDEQHCGILLVEHDMALVRNVCEYLYVLDFGRLIEQGSTEEVLRSDVVRSAYLGEAVVL